MIPETSSTPGWPQYLTDNQGAHYVLLRDGKQKKEFVGEACLYGLVMGDGYIDRKHQWIPISGAKREDMTLSGGTWSTSVQLIGNGQSPINIPDEPIEFPEAVA